VIIQGVFLCVCERESGHLTCTLDITLSFSGTL